MANGFQVLKFVVVDFSDSWDRNVLRDAVMEYRATEAASVKVVRESATGVFTTYRYVIEPNEVVYVIGQVIHLPGHCMGKEQGDNIQCNQG
jgi:hypothetical protein